MCEPEIKGYCFFFLSFFLRRFLLLLQENLSHSRMALFPPILVLGAARLPEPAATSTHLSIPRCARVRRSYTHIPPNPPSQPPTRQVMHMSYTKVILCGQLPLLPESIYRQVRGKGVGRSFAIRNSRAWSSHRPSSRRRAGCPCAGRSRGRRRRR